MDPLSIAASTLGLADITARLVGRIAKFVRDSKNVDEVLRSFCSEVSTLDINLRLVGRTILSHPDLSHVADNQDFLSAIQNTIGNIERTINILQNFLDEIPTNESSNTLQRFLRQRKLDKALPDIARLRLEMVSYNSSLQTVLQAIDISINMSIKIQNDPERFADEFFRATKSLNDKLSELRSDIFKVVEASRPGEPHGAPAQIDPVVSSMHITQRFAERVYSKASTISTTHSDLASHHRPESRVSYDDLPSQYVPDKVPGREMSFRPSGLVDMELLQAQASLKQARAKYGIGELKEALGLCSDALEELSEVQSTPVNAYVEYTMLFQALIHACIGTPEALVESRRLLKTVDAQQLQSVATDDLVLARMALFSWAKFNLSEFEEAEIICRTLIRDARNWNGDTNNDNLNDANTLLALLHYCQNRRRKGQSLSRIIPSDYLRSKFDEAFSAYERDLAFDSNERDMLELFRRLSQPWCRYSAFYYIHYVMEASPGLLLRAAAKYGSVPVIAMLTAGRTSALTTPICACHGEPICKDKKALESPWELAVKNLQLGAVSFMIDSPGILSTLDSVDSTIRAAIKIDTPKIFKFFQDVQSRKADVWNGPDVLNRPLLVGIQCCAKDTVEHLIRHDSELDLNDVDPESSLTLMGLACRNDLARVVHLLIKQGVDIEAYCGFGKRPIHVAVEVCSSNALEVLIENGASIDSTPSPDSQWRNAVRAKCQEPVTLTPLQLSFGVCGKIDHSRRYFLREISMQLFRAGADPSIDYDIEKSCLHLAMEQYPSLFELIAQETPEVFERTFDGETFFQQMLDRMRPLYENYEDDYDEYYNTVRKFHASIYYLVAGGADPMALYADGQTCFHRAVRQEDLTLLKELLKSKKPIDINHKDAHGKTAAAIACDIADEEIRNDILSELEKAGAVIPEAKEENSNAFQASGPNSDVLKQLGST